MEEEIKEEKHVKEKTLDKMTVSDLKEIAKEIPGVTGATAMKKEELLTIIKEFRGIEDEKKPKKKKPVKTKLNIKQLKEKIAGLRMEKKTARESNDRHMIDILRRRINRLKKQTRKLVQG
ncbi:MAG: Rho termination factor N-terminal domain-containing protein [Thermodesulfobacteriota bacterium]|nr:Rho termination factor N-terminal domain-containing protein [Thermodesulfobacteriota bacterium]